MAEAVAIADRDNRLRRTDCLKKSRRRRGLSTMVRHEQDIGSQPVQIALKQGGLVGGFDVEVSSLRLGPTPYA
jgi:hypothetical protein